MVDDSIPFSELLTNATTKMGEFKAALDAVIDKGSKDIAEKLVAELAQSLFTNRKQNVIGKDETRATNDLGQTEQHRSSITRAPADASVEMFGARLKLTQRDIPEKYLGNRSLNASLRGGLIMIFIASSKDGTSAKDIQDEFKRLNMAEAPGTTASRVSKLRSLGLLENTNGNNSGVYRATQSGFKLALKAIQDYGFPITLPAYPARGPENS